MLAGGKDERYIQNFFMPFTVIYLWKLSLSEAHRQILYYCTEILLGNFDFIPHIFMAQEPSFGHIAANPR